MISLSSLLALAERYRDELESPVAPLRLGDRVFDLDRMPVVMGCINLSRDSTYRESIAVSAGSAVRKARVMTAQGAGLVDLGAESSTAAAARVGPDAQLALLLPIVEELADERVLVSVETYDPRVAERCLGAGAAAINFSGRQDGDAICALVAEHRATLILCHVPGANAREISDLAVDDPVGMLQTHFEPRIDLARKHGVENIVIDPGLGFYYRNLTDPAVRAPFQAAMLLNTFRLRRFGVPVCHAMPHAFDLFEDQFRTAEGFFAVLAHLGGTSIYRTHEVPHVVAVLQALRQLGTTQPG